MTLCMTTIIKTFKYEKFHTFFKGDEKSSKNSIEDILYNYTVNFLYLFFGVHEKTIARTVLL